MDLSFTPMGVPIATPLAAAVLRAVVPDEVQLIPVKSVALGEGYQVVNIIRRVPCLDWPRMLARNPALRSGDYPNPLFIDPSRIGDHQLFRLGEWKGVIIIGDRLRKEMEKSGMVGLASNRSMRTGRR